MNSIELIEEIRKTQSGKILIIKFTGKINSDNIFDINKKIKNIFYQEIYQCILDIEELTYINSTGIAMLLNISRTIEKNNGTLVLTQPSSFVKDLFVMTDLHTHFNIVDSLDDALSNF